MSPFKRMTDAQAIAKRIHAREQEAIDRAILCAIGERPLDQDSFEDESHIWNEGFRRASDRR